MSVTLSISLKDIHVVISGVSVLTQVKLKLILMLSHPILDIRSFSVGVYREVQVENFYFRYL